MTLLSWAGLICSFTSHETPSHSLKGPFSLPLLPAWPQPQPPSHAGIPSQDCTHPTPSGLLEHLAFLWFGVCSFCGISIPSSMVLSWCFTLVGFPVCLLTAQAPLTSPVSATIHIHSYVSPAPGAMPYIQCKLLHNSWAPAHTDAYRYGWKFRQSFPFYLLCGTINWPVGLQFGKLSFH